MRQLRPVDVVVDIDVPESGFFADETMTGPYWNTLGVCQTFFGRQSPRWLINQVYAGHATLDGEPFRVPRRVDTDKRHWRLVDVERVAHGLAQNGYIGVDQLVRVIQQVKLVAESWGFIEASEIPTRVEAFDPHRQEVHAVQQEVDLIDDLDGSPGARERSFALGEVEYRLELTDENWNDLVARLAPFMQVARRDSGRTDDPYLRQDRTKIRTWAKAQGLPVGARGPIPLATIRAYLMRQEEPR